MIKAENLYKSFGKLKVLHNVNIELTEGECVALIGPNGCGKTTLIKSILGMVLPNSGSILFEGKSVTNSFDYRRNIGYMPQIGRYPENMTVGQIISTIKSIRGEGFTLDMELYDEFKIPEIINKRMSTLSGGTTQKVSAVLAFLFSPRVLILDEPTAGLDPLASEILKEKILRVKDGGRLVLITSHLLSELDDLITQLVFMQDGRMIFHKTTEALKSETNTERISKAITSILKQHNV